MRPDVLRSGATYRFELSVTFTGVVNPGFAAVTVTANRPPYGGALEITAAEDADWPDGWAPLIELATEIKLKAAAWVDDPEDQPLAYEFRKKRPGESDEDSVAVCPLGPVATCLATLSRGEWMMVLRVCDALNACRYKVGQRIKASSKADPTVRSRRLDTVAGGELLLLQPLPTSMLAEQTGKEMGKMQVALDTGASDALFQGVSVVGEVLNIAQARRRRSLAELAKEDAARAEEELDPITGAAEAGRVHRRLEEVQRDRRRLESEEAGHGADTEDLVSFMTEADGDPARDEASLAGRVNAANSASSGPMTSAALEGSGGLIESMASASKDVGVSGSTASTMLSAVGSVMGSNDGGGGRHLESCVRRRRLEQLIDEHHGPERRQRLRRLQQGGATDNPVTYPNPSTYQALTMYLPRTMYLPGAHGPRHPPRHLPPPRHAAQAPGAP